MSGGGGESSDSSWKPAQSESFQKYTDVAENQFYKEGGFYDPLFHGGQKSYAGWSAEQTELMNQIMGSNDGVAALGLEGLMESLGEYDPNNPALTATIDAMAGDVTRNFSETTQQDIGDAAGQAGQYGSTRHGIAEGIAARGVGEEIAQQAGQMRLADQQQFLANQQANLGNLGNIVDSIVGTAAVGQDEQQRIIDDSIRRWEYETGVPLANLEAMRDLIAIDMGGSGEQATAGGK